MKPLSSCLEPDDIGWIKNALEGPLRRTEKGADATIRDYVLLARRVAPKSFPDTDKGAKLIAAGEHEYRMLDDAQLIPITTPHRFPDETDPSDRSAHFTITVGQWREANAFMRRLEGPSPKVDTLKRIIAEVAAGMVRELAVKPRKAYRKVLSIFYEVVTGRPAELHHQANAVIADRKKFQNW